MSSRRVAGFVWLLGVRPIDESRSSLVRPGLETPPVPSGMPGVNARCIRPTVGATRRVGQESVPPPGQYQWRSRNTPSRQLSTSYLEINYGTTHRNGREEHRPRLQRRPRTFTDMYFLSRIDEKLCRSPTGSVRTSGYRTERSRTIHSFDPTLRALLNSG